MKKYSTIEYLKKGNPRQCHAYEAIKELGVMTDLAEFSPILCGTIPLEIDIQGSDLDIIMEVNEFAKFEEKVRALYGEMDEFRISRSTIRSAPIIKANFHFKGFEFELFGQSQPVTEQNAYLHMIIEGAILEERPTLQKQVISLKKQGLKTEPAFCKVLRLEGEDPYRLLLDYGKERGMI